MRTRVTAVLAISLLVALPCAPPSVAAETEDLSLLSSANAVTLSANQGKDTATTHLALFNKKTRFVKLGVHFEASSDETVHVKSMTPRRLAPEEVTRVAVEFEGLADLREAVSGELVISGGSVPIAQSIKVTPAPQPSLPWPWLIVGGSLLLAAGVAILVARRALPKGKRKARLHEPSPGAKWEAKSWATTLVAAGALFGTVLGGVTFPPYPEQISKEVLTNLSLFFAGLVVVAPFLFQVTRRKILSKDELKAERIGTKATFLVSSTVTLWAVFGQLAAFSLLSWELLTKPKLLAYGAILALAGLSYGAGRYFFRTMSEALQRDWPEEEKEVKTKRKKHRQKRQKEQALAIFEAQGEAARKAGVAGPEAAIHELAAAAAEREVKAAERDPEADEEPKPQTMALL